MKDSTTSDTPLSGPSHQQKHPLIIFTDLDGTLLDHFSYSFEPALPAIEALRARGVPWILTSSKTRAEILELQQTLGNEWPAIFENGGGITFTEQGWKPLPAEPGDTGQSPIRAFGPARSEILAVLEKLASRFQFQGFSTMETGEIMEHTGLGARQATLAAQRMFTEPLLWQDNAAELEGFTIVLEQYNLRCVSGGRFVHVMGQFDKSRAMDWLVQNLPGVQSQTRTVALGDSDNDIGMLQHADLGIVVRSPVHAAPIIHTGNEIQITAQPGPVGWNRAILDILEDC